MTLRVTILTGQSGSGKSTAIRTLEDEGYYCVDNVPSRAVSDLLRTLNDDTDTEQVALGLDIRSKGLVRDLPGLVEDLRQRGLQVRVIYFEAQEASLVQRYSETRRRHPLDDGSGIPLRDVIAKERAALAPVRELADDTMDTTGLSPHELRARVVEQVARVRAGDTLAVAVMSFGFKYGVPIEADCVFDVRFLPNPYFVEALRDGSGLDAEVSAFVLQHPEAVTFVDKVVDLLAYTIPFYRKEGRHYLTVAVGCTGGQHRSVAVVAELAKRFESLRVRVNSRHRDLKGWSR